MYHQLAQNQKKYQHYPIPCNQMPVCDVSGPAAYTTVQRGAISGFNHVRHTEALY